MKTNYLTAFTSPRKVAITISFVMIGILASGLYSYLQDDVYESKVTFKVKPAEAANTGIKLFPSSQTPITEEITSEPFLNKLFAAEGGLVQSFIRYDYKTHYSNYSFPYEIKFRSLENKNFSKQNYKIIADNNETFTIQSESHGVVRTKTAKFNEEIIDNDIALIINKKSSRIVAPDYLIQAPEYLFSVYSPASLTDELLNGGSNIKVNDSDGMITLAVKSTSPVSAGAIASAIANKYITKNQTASAGNDPISTDDQIKKVEEQIAATESEISKYKRSQLLTDIDANTDAALSLNKDLQLKQTSLQLQLAALDNLTNYLRKNRSVNNSQVEYGVINDPTFSEQLLKLNSKYEEKAGGNTSPKLDTEIENLKILISERILNTRKKTAVQIDIINEAIASNEKTVSRIPEQANALSSLERKMQLDKLIYNKLIERKANYILDETVATPSNQIIKPATIPLSPIYPISWLIMLIGALTGFIASYISNSIIDNIQKQKIQTPEELRSESRIPYIATIPTLNRSVVNNTESVNNLCTSVLMMPEAKIITVASSASGEGKTLIASNLAQSLSALDKKVLILDTNIENPGIASEFGVNPEYSLNDVLNSTSDIHDAICLTSFPNIEVLNPGEMNSGINTFLSSKKKDEVLDILKKHYDYIIIDTPVTIDNSGAVAMMKISDLNLYVVQATATRKSSLVNAENIHKSFNINNLYLVLNTGTRSDKSVKSKNNGRNRDRKINVKRSKEAPQNQQPSFLRRIALWFY